MGGLIRRKNRSMPDLTEGGVSGAGGPGQDGESPVGGVDQMLDGGVVGGAGAHGTSLDDSAVGLSVSAKDNPNSGYLSEGHFDYHPISNTNPNLERSKLMRKSFHGSGRSLSIPKVPPPPPVRIGSALTAVSNAQQQHLQQQQQHQQQQQQQQYLQQQNVYCSSSSSSSPSMLQMQKLPLNGVNLRHLEYVTEANQLPPSGIKPFHEANVSNLSTMSSNTSMSEDSCQTIITTCAVVHQEQSPAKPQLDHPVPSSSPADGIEEVDSIVRYHQPPPPPPLELPPYPSPPSTTCHSRQASEDFPPPPPAIDFEPLHEQLNEIQSLQSANGQKQQQQQPHIQNTTSILAQLQAKQLQQQQQQYQQLNNPISTSEILNETTRSEIWLKELQLKQLALKQQQSAASAVQQQHQQAHQQQHQQYQQQKPVINTSTPLNGNDQRSVRDLASRFEQIKLSVSSQQQQVLLQQPPNVRTGMSGLLLADQKSASSPILTHPDGLVGSESVGGDFAPAASPAAAGTDVVDCPRTEIYRMQLPKPRYDIAQSQIQEEIREVEMLNQVVQQTLNNGAGAVAPSAGRTKKKSVSFCDQVILVATADEDEDDGFIPNPILERVLRTAGGGATLAGSANGESESPIPSEASSERLPTLSTSITYHPIKAPSPTQQLKQQPSPAPLQQQMYSLAADMHKQNLEIQRQLQQQQQQYYGVVNNAPTQEQQQQQQQYTSIPANATIFKTHQFSATMPQVKQNTSSLYGMAPAMAQQQQQQQQLRLHHQYGSDTGSELSYDGRTAGSSPYMTVPHVTHDIGPQQSSGYQTVSASPTTITTTNPSPASNSLLRQNLTSLLQQQQQQQLRVAPPNASVYQKPPIPLNGYQQQQQQQQPIAYNGANTLPLPYTSSSPYQRVPLPLGYDAMSYPCEQPPLQQQSKPPQKKVSFEPGTKGGDATVAPPQQQQQQQPAQGVSPSPPLHQHYPSFQHDQQQQNVVGLPPNPRVPMLPAATVKATAVQCNLCRKKHCLLPAIYCTDCESYLARFQMPASTSATTTAAVARR